MLRILLAISVAITSFTSGFAYWLYTIDIQTQTLPPHHIMQYDFYQRNLPRCRPDQIYRNGHCWSLAPCDPLPPPTFKQEDQ